MSIRATDNMTVALYDDTTGQTIGGPLFGPMSGAAVHAEDFVTWAGERLLGTHPDHYPPAAELVALQREWERARLDEDGELVPGGTVPKQCPTHGTYRGEQDPENDCPACERAIEQAEFDRPPRGGWLRSGR